MHVFGPAERRPPRLSRPAAPRDAPDLTVRGVAASRPTAITASAGRHHGIPLDASRHPADAVAPPTVVGSPLRTVAPTKASWHSQHLGRPARPGTARPALAIARGVARRPPRGAAPRHRGTSCGSCGCPAGAGGQRDQGRPGPARVRAAAQPEHAVEPFAVVSGRIGLDGEPLDAADHPPPAVLAAVPRAVQPEPAQGHRGCGSSTPRVLLVRLHLSGFCDVSLSNTLFRAMPGRSRPTWSTPRPASCASGSATATSTTSRSPGSTSPAS